MSPLQAGACPSTLPATRMQLVPLRIMRREDGDPTGTGTTRDEVQVGEDGPVLIRAPDYGPVNITVRFWPDSEPEVFIDGALAEYVAQAALYRAAETLDVDASEEEEAEEEE